jgi:uncharacterized OB-fold protein
MAPQEADREVAAKPPPPRQLPALEPDTAFYWTAGAQGRMLICRCGSCDHYIHPPLPRCPRCAGQVAPQPVSGRGRIASYTINVQPWAPGMPVPFVYAAVELAEQAGLYVMTNVTDCPLREVRIGLPVEVWFEAHEDVHLPMFRPAGDADVG